MTALTPEARVKLVDHLTYWGDGIIIRDTPLGGYVLQAAAALTTDGETIARLTAEAAAFYQTAERVVSEIAEERDAAEARVKVLEEVLRPLADMAERYDPDEGDDEHLECWSGLAVPKIHHLRAARAALKGANT